MIIMQLPEEEIQKEDIVSEYKLFHNSNVFDRARKIFRENVQLRKKKIVVINEAKEVIYFLKWEKNQMEERCYVSEFWEYNVEDSRLDFELLDRGEVYLFLTFEEYTYQIARIIQNRYPQKDIFFVDNKARYFFEDTLHLHIISSIADLYNDYKKCISKTILTIDSKREFLHNNMRFIIKRYRSLSVMTSLFWKCDMITYGMKNPDKIFYVIKDYLGTSGLVDMIKRAMFKIAMVKDKTENIIPIIDFSVKEDMNQFTCGSGDNAWTLYFEQISDIPLEEVYQSKNVIVSSHKGWDWYNPYTYEKVCFMDWKYMFKKYLNIKEEVKQYIEELYDKTVQNKEANVLGVVGRGTDARSERGGMAEPIETEPFLYEVEKAMLEWKCDFIFLATEDQHVYEAFIGSKLYNRMYAVDQYRIDYFKEQNCGLLLSEIKIREQKNGYYDSLKYLGILYILSKCDSLIATCDCGAVRCADALKDNEYRNIKIF